MADKIQENAIKKLEELKRKKEAELTKIVRELEEATVTAKKRVEEELKETLKREEDARKQRDDNLEEIANAESEGKPILKSDEDRSYFGQNQLYQSAVGEEAERISNAVVNAYDMLKDLRESSINNGLSNDDLSSVGEIYSALKSFEGTALSADASRMLYSSKKMIESIRNYNK
jgi:CRISPR/Cas system CSM-associated protein Csm4 (group 5 of RAMP superfamily)